MPDLPPPDLATLRAEIDRIDDALHDLLMRRADLVAHMASQRVKGGAATFRPGREALILRRLLARNQGALARPAIIRLWREIIASSLAQQGNFSVAAQAGVQGEAGAELVARLAREHFGLLTPLKLHPTPSRVLASVANGEAAVAVLPAPQEGERPELAWWTQLDTPRLRIVAALPFLAPRDQEPAAFAVAPLMADATGRDRSLLRIEPEPEMSRARITTLLAGAGLPPRWVMRRDLPNPMALAEVEGLLEEGDPRLAALPFPRLQILGAYAEPEPEEVTR
ncbi:chorismate mutase [Pseudoroseomonas cervicalis]|uniref:chorismate mutase n=1 Tax=Teichococcus cervicalis TaxID=204525 RepID=UPI002780A76B|nr:chorismate mutase [Pseudoroseomonas cervicalis]MDQ1081552.1 chorismate mutase/prephenate dehydratase [Pseudoroseomonas cervicalis]